MMPERQSMDIQTAIYGYTNGNLWIYEWQSIDIRMAIYRYLKRNSQISETHLSDI